MSEDDSSDIKLIECGEAIIRIVGNNIKCCCCYDEINSDDILDCNHCLCLECVKSLNDNVCPMCRGPLSGKNITSSILASIQERLRIENIKTKMKTRIILALSQNISNNMYRRYRLNPNIIFDSSLQVLYGSNPIDWFTNVDLFVEDCKNMYNSITEDYPQMKRNVELFDNIAASYLIIYG